MTPFKATLTVEEFEALTPAERDAWLDRLVDSWVTADKRKQNADDAKDRKDERDGDWTR